jgi:hypothetical protein
MKKLIALASISILSGCYTTVINQSASVSLPIEPVPIVKYSAYSPPVVVQYPSCYMKTVPQYGYLYGTPVVVGSTQQRVCDFMY